MNLETEALTVLARLQHYRLPDHEHGGRLVRMPASAVIAAGLAPVLADPAVGVEAIVKVLLEIETVLIGFGGVC